MSDPTEQMIAILRRDGRASFSEIARELHTNREFVASRINPLIETGKLRIVAGVHPRVLGLNVGAHLSVRVGGNVRRVVDAINALQTPDFISLAVGSFQIVVELQLRNLTELRQEVATIRAIDGVKEVQVLVYERVLKSFFIGPEPEVLAGALDTTDVAIIKRLANDGRANFADVAEAVGLSLSGCRTRVQRLVEANIVHIGAIKQRSDMANELLFGIGANTRDGDREVIDVLLAQPGLEFLCRTVGRFDLKATIGFESLSDFNGLVSTLRSLPSVTDCEQWLHVSLLRESYRQTLDWLQALGSVEPDAATQRQLIEHKKTGHSGAIVAVEDADGRTRAANSEAVGGTNAPLRKSRKFRHLTRGRIRSKLTQRRP
jgi:DNA-binding Lrp family transcriptional regulator